MNSRRSPAQLLRLFSSGVLAQALLSLGSLLASLLLLRHASDADFGRFVLAQAALLLLASLQGAFVGGPVAVLAAPLPVDERRRLLTTVQRTTRRVLNRSALAAVLVLGTLAALGLWRDWLPVAAAASVAALLNLRREMLRGFVQACLRPGELLRADALYVLATLATTLAAAYLSPHPVPWVLLGLAVAAALGSRPLLRSLLSNPGFGGETDPKAWAQIIPLGTWAAAGAGVFWLFSQGYNLLLAASLDVTAVAAVAATRLLMMPVNLLATSLNGLLLPMASVWQRQGGLPLMLKRLLPVVAATVALALLYCGLLWVLRGLAASQLLGKQIAGYDSLLALWMLCGALSLLRNLMQTLLLVQKRFRFMAGLSLAGALVSFAVMLPGLASHGAAAAVLGLVCGEAFYLLAVLLAIGWQLRPVSAARAC